MIRPQSAAEDFRASVNDKFGTILADPPWRFANRTGKMAPEHRRLSRYTTLTVEEICAIPVQDVIREKAQDRKSTRLNSSHRTISYAVFCLKKKNKAQNEYLYKSH